MSKKRASVVGPTYEKKDVKAVQTPLKYFEYEVLASVLHLGMKAFPAEITRRLTLQLQRHVALAQVFVALERLEAKGFVSSQESDPEPVRGGRRRRIFKVLASGADALRSSTATYSRMSRSVGDIYEEEAEPAAAT